MNVFEKYPDIDIRYEVASNEYSIYINGELVANEKGDSCPYMGSTIYESCENHVNEICAEIKRNEKSMQDEILAEVLLGQAEIIANQSAQDEVLAEMLLNSLEV